MKDESPGNPIIEFVGLKAKMYSYLTENGKEAMRAKGIQRSLCGREITFSRYKEQLETPAENLLVNRRFQSEAHIISTVAQEKRGLSAYDDKRFILADGINTLAYGHRTIRDRMVVVDMPEALEDVETMSDASLLEEGLMIEEQLDQLGEEIFWELWG